MVAPRLPSNQQHQRKRRRKHSKYNKNNIDPRVLLIPLILAGLAISWNIIRLFRSLFWRPRNHHPADDKLSAPLAHTKNVESWNYDWCTSSTDNKKNDCQYRLALDLQDFLQDDRESTVVDLLEEMVPDPQEIREIFELDDDDNNNNNNEDESKQKKKKKQKRNNTSSTTTTQRRVEPMTDDLDNHPDVFGNLVVNSASARFEESSTLTPRILVEARRNMTTTTTTYDRQFSHNNHSSHHLRFHNYIYPKHNDYSALLSRRGLGGSHFYNQDRAILVDPYPVDHRSNSETHHHPHHPLHNNFFLGIFDGHGLSGHIKSDYAAATLPRLLQQQLVAKLYDNRRGGGHHTSGTTQSQHQIRQVLSNVFWQVHKEGPLLYPNDSSGCTASIIVRLEDELYFANVGDSRSMLVSIDPHRHPEQDDGGGGSGISITHLTQPHKPNHPKERQRIVQAGCVVIDPIPFQDPTARVAASLDGEGMALAMSRSLGDYDLEQCGVIPEPAITVVDLKQQQQRHQQRRRRRNSGKTKKEEEILLAISITDGIMDAVSLQEVAQALAVPFLLSNNKPKKDEHNPSNSRYASALELAAEDLIRTASDRWLMNTTFFPYRDDITIAVRRVQ